MKELILMATTYVSCWKLVEDFFTFIYNTFPEQTQEAADQCSFQFSDATIMLYYMINWSQSFKVHKNKMFSMWPASPASWYKGGGLNKRKLKEWAVIIIIIIMTVS